MKGGSRKEICCVTVFTILGIICFPINPLILTGVIVTKSYPVLSIIGWVVWTFGMVLVMAPIILFPRRGGVPKGKAFIHTTRMVHSGIYAIVRHPQYLGGILAIFVTTPLFYPHWLFGLLGVIGAVAVYMSCRAEERRLVQQFGDDYLAYMERVPRMNIASGVIRLLRHKQPEDSQEED